MKRYGYAFLDFAVPIAIAVVVLAVFIVYIITHSNNVKFKPLYVKSMATLNQAANMSKINPGFDFSEATIPCPETVEDLKNLHSDDNTVCTIFNNTLMGYKIAGKVSDLTYRYKDKTQKYKVQTDLLPDDYTDYILYQLKDGSYLAINREAKNCELPIAQPVYNVSEDSLYKTNTVDLNKCIGFVDINGYFPPNKEAYCTTGKNIMDNNADCYVDMRHSKITDVYPILFYNSQVVPLTAAAKKAYLESRAK